MILVYHRKFRELYSKKKEKKKMESRVAPHSFNFFKMLVDKTKYIDDTEAGLCLDFVVNA